MSDLSTPLNTYPFPALCQRRDQITDYIELTKSLIVTDGFCEPDVTMQDGRQDFYIWKKGFSEKLGITLGFVEITDSSDNKIFDLQIILGGELEEAFGSNWYYPNQNGEEIYDTLFKILDHSNLLSLSAELNYKDDDLRGFTSGNVNDLYKFSVLAMEALVVEGAKIGIDIELAKNAIAKLKATDPISTVANLGGAASSELHERSTEGYQHHNFAQRQKRGSLVL